MSFDRNNRDQRPRDNYRRDDRGDRYGGERGNFERPKYGDREGERRNFGGDRPNTNERRGDDRNNAIRQRGGNQQGGFNFKDKMPKWTDYQVTELKNIVENMKKEGKVDWDLVGQKCNNRKGASCFSKYTQVTEIEWTPEQDVLLGEYWEKNHTKFNVMEILSQLEGHTKRGTLFRLERITDGVRGPYKPLYRMGPEEILKFD